jgi:hypothetical protein
MIANTTLSVHTITKLKVTNPASYGAPLVINCERGRGDSTEITLFLDNQELVDALVIAINSTIEAHTAMPPKSACPAEAAAYEAELHAYKWSGL